MRKYLYIVNDQMVVPGLKDTDPELEVTSYLTPYKDVGYPGIRKSRK